MSTIEVAPFSLDELAAAAALFVKDYSKLRATVPELAPGLADPDRVAGLLAELFDQCPGLVARIDGKLAGCLGWYMVPDFRGTNRLAAYVPEWGHLALIDHLPAVYQALYNAAVTRWAAAGCQVHAITHLAHNHQEQEFWFWNGFGMLVVDAVRPMQPLERKNTTPLTIRKANPADGDALYALDVEHRRHYNQPPVLMAPREITSPEAFAAFIDQPENAIWMAWDGDTPAGFIRFDTYEVEGATILEGEDSAFISGAFVRPAYRGQGTASAMLAAALGDYARRGYKRCTLDFESFNPEARAFWLKYFQPVAYSLMRVPEATG